MGKESRFAFITAFWVHTDRKSRQARMHAVDLRDRGEKHRRNWFSEIHLDRIPSHLSPQFRTPQAPHDGQALQRDYTRFSLTYSEMYRCSACRHALRAACGGKYVWATIGSLPHTSLQARRGDNRKGCRRLNWRHTYVLYLFPTQEHAHQFERDSTPDFEALGSSLPGTVCWSNHVNV